MSKQERTERALQLCMSVLKDEFGCTEAIHQAEAILNEPQIRVGEHFYGIAIEDDGGGYSNGEPILHETPLHKSRTIKAALDRAGVIGDRYGRKYLALITILEEV